jgi:large subunit ribosomal protein L25
MSNKVLFKVQPRTASGKGAARKTRRDGFVPAVIYGNKASPELVSLNPRELARQMQAKGFRTRQFELEIEGSGKKELAMCQAVQYDKVSDRPIHVDFMRIDLNKEISVEIPFKFINEDKSVGVKKGGVLNIVERDAAIVCKPADIVDEIVVDVENLDVAESIHSDAIALPQGLRFESHEVFTIATIASAVEEVVEEAAPATAADVPSEGELKKEEKGEVGDKKDAKPEEKKDAKK